MRTPEFLGMAAGSWCGFGLNADAPWDQRADDGMSVCFETAPLPERLEILGAPVLTARAVVSTGRTPCCARGSAMSRRMAPRCASPTACSTSRIATATSIPSRSSPAGAIPSASSSTMPRMPFRPATASASRCRRPTGRSPGPRPRPQRSRCRPAAAAFAPDPGRTPRGCRAEAVCGVGKRAAGAPDDPAPGQLRAQLCL